MKSLFLILLFPPFLSAQTMNVGTVNAGTLTQQAAQAAAGGGSPSVLIADSHSGASVSSLTKSITGGGVNRVIVVGINVYLSAATISSVTYAGDALTLYSQTNYYDTGGKCAMYYRIAPATGANNCVVTFSGSVDEACMGVLYITNAHQTTPFGTASINALDSAANSLAVTVAGTDTTQTAIDVFGQAVGSPADVCYFTAMGATAQCWTNAGANLSALQMSMKPGVATSTVMVWTNATAFRPSLIGVGVKRP